MRAQFLRCWIFDVPETPGGDGAHVSLELTGVFGTGDDVGSTRVWLPSAESGLGPRPASCSGPAVCLPGTKLSAVLQVVSWTGLPASWCPPPRSPGTAAHLFRLPPTPQQPVRPSPPAAPCPPGLTLCAALSKGGFPPSSACFPGETLTLLALALAGHLLPCAPPAFPVHRLWVLVKVLFLCLSVTPSAELHGKPLCAAPRGSPREPGDRLPSLFSEATN